VSDRCDRPLELDLLIGYWLDGVAGPDLDAVEEHLLGCESCSRRLAGLAALGEGVRRLAHDGVVGVVVTPAFLAKASEEGLHTREYRLAPGERVDCTVTAQDDLLVARLRGDFRGLSRLDVVSEEVGRPVRRIEDVPIGPEAAELMLAFAMPYVRALQHTRTQVRLVAKEPGGERLVGEYTFDHHPTP
jgi:hypothetical protein